MPLAEILVFSLGPSIAKTVLKCWLRDDEVAADISSDLVSLLGEKTKDIYAQQHGRYQLEAIGVQAAENLRPLFDASHLDESGKVAVALEVAETIENARIDPALLAQHDLDPNQIARHLLAMRSDSCSHFSNDEAQLYRRTISESAYLIVENASQLPSFTEQTFAEVLKRDNLLLAKSDEILDRMHLLENAVQKLARWNQESESVLLKVLSDTPFTPRFRELVDFEREARHRVVEDFEENPDSRLSTLQHLTPEQVCGSYAVLGHNPAMTRSMYAGKLTIKGNNQILQARWTIGPRPQEFEGTGLLSSNVLGMVYREVNPMPSRRRLLGIMQYEFTTEQAMSGSWVGLRGSSSGFEWGRKRSAADLPALSFYGL